MIMCVCGSGFDYIVGAKCYQPQGL